MTSIRETLRRLFRRTENLEADRYDPDKAAFSYTIFWTKQVRTWNADQRDRAGSDVADVLRAEDFEPNPLQRRYRLPSVDESLHAGSSVLALQQVLRAFEEQDADQT